LNSAVRGQRSTVTRVWMAVAAVLLFCTFLSLGTWQVQRRAWKLDLIARVEQRVDAPAVSPPPPGEWSRVTAANSEYRHVQATGVFLNDSETLVQALTDLGAGFWVLTPLRLGDGTVVLVNRGFVPPEQRERAAHGAAEATTAATVTGLLRITEPKGWFLRRNDPAKDHWYSRDVHAIAVARGLGSARVAPYFIDQEASTAGSGARGAANSAPVGGLTVIAFRNTHLTYAITWYGLALLVVVGTWIVIREERRRA
jgi:surfeit locus 1 family protein